MFIHAKTNRFSLYASTYRNFRGKHLKKKNNKENNNSRREFTNTFKFSGKDKRSRIIAFECESDFFSLI